jgi:hypothetical protein
MERLSAHRLMRWLAQLRWEVQRAVRFVNRQYGVWGWILATCAVMSVLAVLFARDQVGTLSELQMRWAQAQLQPRTGEKTLPVARLVEPAQASADGRTRLQAFETHLLRPADLPAVVQNLLQLAQNQGLLVLHGDYRPQIDAAGSFMRYRMTWPIKGQAAAIQAFVQAALLSEKTLALESVQFKRERIESAEIEARIQWVVFTQLPTQGAAQ